MDSQPVEIRLYNAEEIALKALLPYAESIAGIYVFGPHAAGSGSPEEAVDVLVIADKVIDLDGLDGVNCTIIARDAIDEYVRTHPAEYAEMISEALPLMNKNS